VTPQPRAWSAATTRAPLPLLLLLYAIPFVVATLTPAADFAGGPQGDVRLYLDKAYSVLTGGAPYRDFPLEYPPFALVPMIVPYVLWPFGPVPVHLYPWLFAGEMAVLLVALALVVGRIVRRQARWLEQEPRDVRREQLVVGTRLLVLALGASLALTWRFDLFPTLLASVALWAALERRPTIAGVAIGIGVLAKLFPIVVAPAAAVVWLAPPDWPRLLRFGLAAALTVVLGMAPFVALAGADAFSFVGYQAARGLQIESVGGGLVLLWGLVTGEPNAVQAPFSAWEVTGDLARMLQAVASTVLVAGFGALAVLGWRRCRTEMAEAGAVASGTIVTLGTVAILLLVLTNKVFSIQYVVWLVPFAALLPWRQFWLAAAAVALTIPIHPALYEALVRQDALPILVLNLRNGLLVALLVWLVLDLARTARPQEDVASL
jgi:hypothetical protein